MVHHLRSAAQLFDMVALTCLQIFDLGLGQY